MIRQIEFSLAAKQRGFHLVTGLCLKTHPTIFILTKVPTTCLRMQSQS